MITFKNKGTLELDFISTFGASVKSAGAIGYFGTGLKFAIATLLRNNQKVRLITNGETYNFVTVPVVLRGETFKMVGIEGHPVNLSFTTELGKNWEMWMAFRELYCNALDEGGSVINTETYFADTHTYFVVEGDLIEKEFAEKENNFLIGRQPLVQTPNVDIYEGKSPYIFYKGIRVATLPRQSEYTYNIKSKQELTEDRTLKSRPDFELARALTSLSDYAILNTVLCSSLYEGLLDYDWMTIEPSAEFFEVGLDILRNDGHKLSPSAKKRIYQKHPNLQWKEVGLSPIQEKQLAKAKDWAAYIGFPVVYPVKIVETLGKVNLALADVQKKEIILSKQLFEAGTKTLCAALIEEVIHIREGLCDETRELQSFLFNKIVSLAEELKGEAI